ncbi:hypothetical protein K443DRAFT_611736 [Laccaria amethystina LaAM-08-1]|uniref:Uncharacterized protein n=1 Tax=Laccaria amethystina LaAM-08-1 TaxID=1095629 RepID=A0A0C9XFN1_9AGAR|nr:hypothetical protein K443DRAFT_611736 [Laccaria amethystina LaAM-08-1]
MDRNSSSQPSSSMITCSCQESTSTLLSTHSPLHLLQRAISSPCPCSEPIAPPPLSFISSPYACSPLPSIPATIRPMLAVSITHLQQVTSHILPPSLPSLTRYIIVADVMDGLYRALRLNST